MEKEISLIIPCAGKSSRFPNKPKWLLTCPDGDLMIQKCIKGLNLENVSDIYITFLKEHIDKYLKHLESLEILFEFINKKINIKTLILEKATNSQSETVYKTIKHFNIKKSIFIKDCDNYFEHKIENKNYICFLEVNESNKITKLYNKSFLEFNNLNQVTNICEKEIISKYICVGGYSFDSSKNFIDLYESIVNKNNNKNENILINELYISHIICKALIENYIFYGIEIGNYIDWGTIEEWEKYKNEYKTIFIDLDGTLVKNSGEYSKVPWGNSEPLKENIKYLQELYKTNKVKIIITTARKSSYREITINQLKKYNIPYDSIIFDLYHSKRYLINDYSDTNKYPTSISVNIKRDNNELNELI